MSTTGRPGASTVDAVGLTLGIVATHWHAELVDQLVKRAEEAATACGITDLTTVRVHGAVEIPVVAQELALGHDAVVALGTVVRGETPHFDVVCQSLTHGLTTAALETSTPLANGVLTCETEQQARERCGFADGQEDKGWEATIAALDSVLVLRDLRARRGVPAV